MINTVNATAKRIKKTEDAVKIMKRLGIAWRIDAPQYYAYITWDDGDETVVAFDTIGDRAKWFVRAKKELAYRIEF